MVGQYRIEKKLAEGGMGIVYAAVQPLIGKRVAVKLLHGRFANEQVLVERFIQEARAVNTIGHPNIVDIFAIDKLADGTHYFVMELLEGEDLAKLLKRRQRFTIGEAIPILLQIAQALAAAHEKSVVHRDLKPDNVYLLKGHTPKVKLLDFGVAKLLDNNNNNAKMTNAGGLIGTPYYMSTEQCNGGEITGQSDLYSLAVLTYEMLAGSVPFGGNYLEVITSHLQRNPPPLPASVDLGAATAPINALIAKAMSKKPEERPPGVLPFVEELERIALTAGVYTPSLGISGANSAVVSSSLQLAMLHLQTGSFRVVQAPEADESRPRKITTLTGATGELSSKSASFPAASTQPRGQIAPRASKRTLSALIYSASALIVLTAIALALVLKNRNNRPPPVLVVASAPAPSAAASVRIETDPLGGDVFDKDGFLLGRAPLTLDPTKELSVTVRWRGRFSSVVSLEGQTGKLSITPTRPAEVSQEPLLVQLADPSLGLNPDAMSQAHAKHPAATCESCHATEMVLDASLCQGCHKEGGPSASLDALNKKQCGSCHTPEFKPSSPRAKFHLSSR
jgi:serine/threonine-protein kinase